MIIPKQYKISKPFKRTLMGQRGQFFFPDVIVAAGVFLFALAFFWSASSSIYSQTELLDLRRSADESAHTVLNNLVLSAGEPSNWVPAEFSDINAFGIASSPNMLNREKTLSLMNKLNSDANYQSVKEKLGLGPFDLRLILLDSDGVVINESGVDLNAGSIALNPKLLLIYKRLVYYNGGDAVLQGIVSLAP